jgi:hypothetical protein
MADLASGRLEHRVQSAEIFSQLCNGGGLLDGRLLKYSAFLLEGIFLTKKPRDEHLKDLVGASEAKC